MEVKRINHKNVCQIRSYDLSDKKASYIVYPDIEKTKIVNHAFSTRSGGVSTGYYAEMNVSFTRGDEQQHVLENYRRIARIMQCSVEDFVCSDQTHTTNVRKVTRLDKGKGVVRKKDYSDVDGLITNESGICLATFYADCVPVFLIDPVHKAIGLCHSGWKGTVLEIGLKTVRKMEQTYGSNPKDIYAAIAPSICQDCYEVSEDVIIEFQKVFLADASSETDCGYPDGMEKILYTKKENGKYQLNLWNACYYTLRKAGVLDEHIEVTDICTCCNPQYLFSHRASQGKRGNLGAFLMIK